MLYHDVTRRALLRRRAHERHQGDLHLHPFANLAKAQVEQLRARRLAPLRPDQRDQLLRIAALGDHQIGDAGLSSLADACAEGSLAKLETLLLSGNPAGVEAQLRAENVLEQRKRLGRRGDGRDGRQGYGQ